MPLSTITDARDSTQVQAASCRFARNPSGGLCVSDDPAAPSTLIFATNGEARFAESQRDSATKPRVARHELPWVVGAKPMSTPTGLRQPGCRTGHNPFRVETLVGRSSQGRRIAPTLGWKSESPWDSNQSGSTSKFMDFDPTGRSFPKGSQTNEDSSQQPRADSLQKPARRRRTQESEQGRDDKFQSVA